MADSALFNTVYNPDVLTCLANLSSDEVFTPPEIANAMLDTLPQELFKNPNTTFLDPGCKSGVFLREITKRLLDGLEDEIPDLHERIDHILHHQVYGISITEITSLLSRRSLYCSKYPNSEFSVSHFDTAEGNIRYKRIEHSWKDGKCVFCGASQSQYQRSEDLETHAYEMIHVRKPEDIFGMKFDVIIGNPPYQLSDGGNGSSAMPIYNKFVEQAKKLKPRFLSMIIPSRWFAGGKGLDDFRLNMLTDKHVTNIVDYVNAKDCFPGVSLGGGVCYFLWERDAERDCTFTNIHDGKKSTSVRNLSEFPVFVRYNEAISIIHKAAALKEETVAQYVGSRNPFGFPSSARGSDDETLDVRLHSSAGVGFVDQRSVLSGKDDLKKYKVMISKVTSEHAGEPDKSGMFKVVSRAKVLGPMEVCTDSYLIAFSSNNEKEVTNFYSYLCTKFFRFLLLQAVSSINLSKDKFCFIPVQNFNESWTDEKLYSKYGLDQDEIDFIEGMMKPMEMGGDE